MKDYHDIIIRPIVSERSMGMLSEMKYTFVVARDANKIEIKQAAEQIFGVKVMSVTTMNVLGKYKRMGAHRGKRADWKKAVIKLEPGTKEIEFFQGLV